MDLLTVILACSLHPDDRLVEAFVRKLSDANPLFVGDFVSLATHDDLASPEQALELARSIADKGGRPGLGLMAIPMTWAARFNREPADLLDPCTNISIGTAMMASFAADCAGSRQHAKARRGPARPLSRRKLGPVRGCILGGFERDIGVRGFTHIIAEIPRLPVRDLDADLPPERSSVFERDAPEARPQAPVDPSAPTASAPPRAMSDPARRTPRASSTQSAAGARTSASLPGHPRLHPVAPALPIAGARARP